MSRPAYNSEVMEGYIRIYLLYNLAYIFTKLRSVLIVHINGVHMYCHKAAEFFGDLTLRIVDGIMNCHYVAV